MVNYTSGITGVSDEPNTNDQMELGVYSRSLIKFIENSPTPFTVGIQGEWGSGKTSLMLKIKENFTPKKKKVGSIWINAWQSSLTLNPNQALFNIMREILHQMGEHAGEGKKGNTEIKNLTQNLKELGKIVAIGTAGFFGSSIAAKAVAKQIEKQNSGTSEEEDSRDESSKQNISLNNIQRELENVVNKITNEKDSEIKKFHVYIDDLDRIEPSQAIEILDLLKNVFSLKNCIFILAIDYPVVVKGLKHKYKEDNIKDYEAYFDKIIQLAFKMPIVKYDTNKIVTELLIEHGGFKKFQANEKINLKKFIDIIHEVINDTLGKNPRKLKRLFNSLSLFDIIDKEEIETNPEPIDEDTEVARKSLRVVLLCLQNSFPIIYNLFQRAPDFQNWDYNFAIKISKEENEIDEIQVDEQQWEKEIEDSLVEDDLIDDGWEKAVFLICNRSKKLIDSTTEILRVLNKINEICDLFQQRDDTDTNTTTEEIIKNLSLLTITDYREFDSSSNNSKKSKLASSYEIDEKTIEKMKEFRINVMDELSKSESIIFSKNTRRNVHSQYFFFSPPNSFISRSENFKPLWGFHFFKHLGIRIDGTDPNNPYKADKQFHSELLTFALGKENYLKDKLPGNWKIGEGGVRKYIAYDFSNLKKYLDKIEQNQKRDQILVSEKDIFEIVKHNIHDVVPLFEKLVIEIINEYIDTVGSEPLYSPTQWGGGGRFY